MDDNLQVHDINMSETPQFTPTGIKQQTTLRFFVGQHGPFTIHYDPGMATAQKIRDDIDAKVQLLRTVEAAKGY